MATRLKLVKAVLSELIQDCTNFQTSNRGLKGFSSPFIRLFKHDHGVGSSQSKSNREMWQISSTDGALEHFQDGRTLKEWVVVLIDRVDRGIAVDSFDFIHVLRRCSKHKDFTLVKQVHGCIKKSQMEQHLYVATNLLKCYIVCGRLQTAHEIFNKLLKKDTVVWNIMIGGCAEHNQGEVAIQLYNLMLFEGGQPDALTYMSALKACASPTALKWGKLIHDHIKRDGFQADVRMGSALVLMYMKCGSIEDARAVFGKMERRDVISWNVIIGGLAQHGLGHEAFSLFIQMQREGFIPDSFTYVNILNPCSSKGALGWVKEVHAHAMKAGLHVNLRVGSALVLMYAKCGSIEDAKIVFDRIERRDVVIWSVMIGGLAQHGLGHEAYFLFLQMQEEGLIPDLPVYLSILNPRSSKDALEWVREVHAHAMKAGLDMDVRVGNALVDMYAQSGSIEDARVAFDKIVGRDVVSWSVMIGGLAQHGLGHEAFALFLQMQREGFTPNVITYLSILNPCSSKGAVEWVKEIHTHAMKAGLDVDVRLGNALVQMYAKLGIIGDAKEVFNKMVSRNIISWTVMIAGLAQHGYGREALQLFRKLKSEGVKPSTPLFVTVLSACSHAGLVDEGRGQFVSMKRDYGMEPGLEHYTCMVDILGRAGHLEEARILILNMPIKPDVVAWTSFLGACKIYQKIDLAELAANECLKLEPTATSPHVLLSNVYAAVGSWDQVSLVRTRMHEKGVSKDPVQCWIEDENKFHHFGVGDQSHP